MTRHTVIPDKTKKSLPAEKEKTQWITLGQAAEEITNIQEKNGVEVAVIDAIREFSRTAGRCSIDEGAQFMGSPKDTVMKP